MRRSSRAGITRQSYADRLIDLYGSQEGVRDKTAMLFHLLDEVHEKLRFRMQNPDEVEEACWNFFENGSNVTVFLSKKKSGGSPSYQIQIIYNDFARQGESQWHLSVTSENNKLAQQMQDIGFYLDKVPVEPPGFMRVRVRMPETHMRRTRITGPSSGLTLPDDSLTPRSDRRSGRRYTIDTRSQYRRTRMSQYSEPEPEPDLDPRYTSTEDHFSPLAKILLFLSFFLILGIIIMAVL